MPDDELWAPSVSVQRLRQRHALMRSVRQFFQSHGYLEVETPLLSSDVCIDAWIDPIPVNLTGTNSHYLQTSPEFAMKRLLAAGADRIYQITKSFRRGETGTRHNPEFTILEWYVSGDSYSRQMDYVERFVRHVANVPLENGCLNLTERRFTRRTYDEAFEQVLGTGVLELPNDAIRQLARDQGITPPSSMPEDDRDGWLNLLLAERIEPAFAGETAWFLYDFPESQAALAQVRKGDPPIAERFELYLNGIEICNGYQELTDPGEFLNRMQRQNQLRQRAGSTPLPERSRLLQAMRSGFPKASGVALGLDRLFLWRLGLSSLEDIMPFPIDRA